jgi:hypothetical protein
LATSIAKVSKLRLELQLDAQNDFVATLNGFEALPVVAESRLTAA